MKHRSSAGRVAKAMTALVAFAVPQLEFASHVDAQQAQEPGPGQMRPELDNESVLVLRIRMAPHEKTGLHDVSARLVIWLTDAHLRETKADGTTTEYRRPAHSIEWVPAQQHAGENLSDDPIEFLAIVPKPDAAGTSPGDHRPQPSR